MSQFGRPATGVDEDDAVARQGDVEILRRLTREAFAEITTMRDRVRDLEKSAAAERASKANAERVRVSTRVEFGTSLAGSLGGTAIGLVKKGVEAITTIEAPFPGRALDYSFFSA